MAEQALKGIKVADFGWVLVDPITNKYLADHGAEVIRIESGTRIDMARIGQPYKDDIPGLNRAPMFAVYNANKYGVSLNLLHPRAAEVMQRIIAWADVIANGFTPGTMEQLGLGYDDVKRLKPDIIMLSTSMQGQTGPRSSHPGLGLQLTGLSGFNHLTGWPDRHPTLPYGAYTDVITPPLGAAAVIAALDYRRRTGKGQHIDLSQYEVGVQFLSPLILDFTVNKRIAFRNGNRCAYAAPHGVYPCRGQDRWCALAVFSDVEWLAFCQTIGKPAWITDHRFTTLLGRKENEDELDKLIAERTIQVAAEGLMAIMQSAGVSAGVVQNSEDLYHDPQLKYRGHFQEMEHREIGRHWYEKPGYILSETPAELRMPGPCLGEHNGYVYTKLLGFSDDEFVELLADGVFD